MPVSPSPKTAPLIKFEIGCNIHQVPPTCQYFGSRQTPPGAAAHLSNNRQPISINARCAKGKSPPSTAIAIPFSTQEHTIITDQPDY
jgi:hypothetical protein